MDQSRADDRDVVQTFTVEERVAPVIVAVVLVGLPRLRRSRRIVGSAIVTGGFIRFG